MQAQVGFQVGTEGLLHVVAVVGIETLNASIGIVSAVHRDDGVEVEVHDRTFGDIGTGIGEVKVV